jgi:hypothetical protein
MRKCAVKNRLKLYHGVFFNKLLHKIIKGITMPEGFCMLAFTERFSERSKERGEETTEHKKCI